MLRDSGDVVTMECVEKLIKKDMLNPITSAKLKEKDIIPLQRVCNTVYTAKVFYLCVCVRACVMKYLYSPALYYATSIVVIRRKKLCISHLFDRLVLLHHYTMKFFLT